MHTENKSCWLKIRKVKKCQLRPNFLRFWWNPCDYHNLIIYIYCSAAKYSVDRNSAEYKFLWISWNTEFYNNMEFLQWKSCSVRNFINQNFLDTRSLTAGNPQYCKIEFSLWNIVNKLNEFFVLLLCILNPNTIYRNRQNEWDGNNICSTLTNSLGHLKSSFYCVRKLF